MRNRFDQFVKRLARKGLSPAGRVETEAEVAPDTRRIDVWFVPDATRARNALRPLGLLGRMARRSCTLEPFHCTPSGDQVADCFVKHRLFCAELARREPRPPIPTQWIISAGRASDALAGLNFRKSRRRAGIYDAPALMRTMLVVVSELPRTRDTLLVRLMGAGETLKRALSDLRALPPGAPERRLALPILVRLRLDIPTDPAKQSKSDREFLMTTKEIDKYLEELEQKGRKEGRGEGYAEAVLAAYKVRFGAPPAALAAAVEGEGDHATLQRWLEMVMTRSVEDVAATLLQSKTRPRARTTTRRVGAPTRRAATSR